MQGAAFEGTMNYLLLRQAPTHPVLHTYQRSDNSDDHHDDQDYRLDDQDHDQPTLVKVMITTNFTLNAKRPPTTGEKAMVSYMHPSVATMAMIIII